MQRSWRSITKLSVVAAVGGLSLLVYSQTTPKIYEPPSAEIEQLAIDTTMTPDAQQIFYKQKPVIASKAEFHERCRQVSKHSAKTIILGCYIYDGHRGKIVIQSITDARLDGMMEVVAAHEMLHAAYQELSQAERDRLTPKLKKAAQRVEDARLASVLEGYEKGGDPITYVVELHAHLGTELADLGDPELEEHYQEYFLDRQQVTALARQSRSTLAKLDAEAEQLKPEIEALESSLKDQKAYIQRANQDLKASSRNLGRMKSNLLSLKQRAERSLSQGDPSLVRRFQDEQARFNSEVDQHNWQVQDLQERVTRLNQQVDTYQDKVDAYNELAKTSRSILSSLKVNAAEYTVPELSQ